MSEEHAGWTPNARRLQVASGRHAEAAVAQVVALYRTHRFYAGRYQPRGGLLPTALVVPQYPKPIGRGQGKMQLVRKGVPDYFGVYLAGDRQYGLSFDVKAQTGEVSFALPTRYQHQLAFLDEVVRDGGVAFFLIIDLAAGWAWVLDSEEQFAQLKAGERVRYCVRENGKPVRHLARAIPRAQLPGTAVYGFDFLGWLR